jgi:glycosidase
MLTLDGVPLLYNGMEVGDATESGDPALFEKMPVFWKIAKRRPEYARFYKQMIALRRSHAALRQGETEWLRNSDEARVVTYLRRDGGEEFLVAVNFSNRPFTGLVEAGESAAFADVTPDISRDAPLASPVERAAKVRRVGLPALALEAWGFRIFRRTLR